jgi:hypothetical protein
VLGQLSTATIVGGRRPWVSLKMMSYIEPA